MEKPIVFFLFSFIIGCLVMLFFYTNIFCGAALAALFAFFLLWLKWKDIGLNYIFFFLGLISFFMYFQVTIPRTFETRIIYKDDIFCISKYKNRKLYLNGDLIDVEIGEKIYVNGDIAYNKDYYRGIIGSIYVSDYSLSEDDIISKFYSVKNIVYNKYSIRVGKEYTSEIMAACFGDTQYLDYNKRLDMNRLGIAHIMAVSGFHVAIIYGVSQFFLGSWALFICFIYVIFTGMKASSIRAFIMLFLMKISKKIYRNYDSKSALALAAIVILILNPYYIANMGFALSFLATIGIVLYYHKFRKNLYKLPGKVRDGVSITLCAQLFTVPYLMMNGVDISTNSIPGNLIIVPLYTIMIILGNIGAIFIKVKPLFELICYVITGLMTAIRGASFLLLKISFPVKNYTYVEGVVVILIYMCYIFVKRGYDEVKLFPLIIVSFLMIYKLGII